MLVKGAPVVSFHFVLCSVKCTHVSVMLCFTLVYSRVTVNMMTSSNGNIFRVTGHLCGEFTGHRWIPRRKANDAELWCFLDLRLNKRLSKQSWGWWFEMLSHPIRRHCNEFRVIYPYLRRLRQRHRDIFINSGRILQTLFVNIYVPYG